MPRTQRVSLAAVLGALAVTVTACGDSTGPESVGIAVSVTQLRGPSITPEENGRARVGCSVDFRAVARGSGAATWLDATVHWYAGTKRLPLDSVVVSAAEIQASWGEPGIDAGETRDSPGWEFSAGVPFTVTLDYRYQPEGSRAAKTARVSFSCGPAVPPGTPPPTVSALSVSAPPGDFEPGDTLDVEYAAASPVGLWQTAVLLTGPCEVRQPFNEELAPSVTRVVRIRIPAECQLGVPLGVTVYAFDVGLQEGRRQLAPPLSLVDKTPPAVFSLFNSVETLAGDYFVGDSVPVFVGAADNHALSAIVWDVLPSGGRDSLLVTGPARVAPGPVWVPLRPEWVGQVQLRFYARDAMGLTSAPLTMANALGVYPTVERPTASASVPGEIRDFAIDARRGAIYVLQTNERRLAIVSTATLQVTATIPTPGAPTGFDLTPGGDSLIVALPSSKALGVLDLRQASPQLALLPLTTLDATLG